MIVCHCKAISDRQLRQAVRGGARCRVGVARACGAGSVCGGCGPVIEEILAGEAASVESGPGLEALELSPAR